MGPGGGLPDGFVRLTINGAVFTTPTVQDSVTPTWSSSTAPTLVPGGTSLRIDVLDEDLAVDDNAWACQANPLSADLLRSRLISCNGPATLPGATVTLDVRPN